MTTITTTTYACEKCGTTNIPASQTFHKKEADYHRVQSAISGGGSRYCGPVMPELKKEDAVD